MCAERVAKILFLNGVDLCPRLNRRMWQVNTKLCDTIVDKLCDVNLLISLSYTDHVDHDYLILVGAPPLVTTFCYTVNLLRRN